MVGLEKLKMKEIMMINLNISLTKKSTYHIKKLIFDHDKIEIYPNEFSLMTDGGGFWSNSAKLVPINKIVLHKECKNIKFRYIYSISVYFDTAVWSVEKDGLIYTDETFLIGIKEFLKQFGKNFERIDYCEQGSQGDNYVHFVT